MHPHPAPLALHPPGHVLEPLPSPQLPAHHHRRSRTDDRPDRRDLAAAAGHRCHRIGQDRTSVVSGKSVSVRVDPGGRRIIKQKTTDTTYNTHQGVATTT